MHPVQVAVVFTACRRSEAAFQILS